MDLNAYLTSLLLWLIYCKTAEVSVKFFELFGCGLKFEGIIQKTFQARFFTSKIFSGFLQIILYAENNYFGLLQPILEVYYRQGKSKIDYRAKN